MTVIRNALLGTFREIVRVRHDDSHFRHSQTATKHVFWKMAMAIVCVVF